MHDSSLPQPVKVPTDGFIQTLIAWLMDKKAWSLFVPKLVSVLKNGYTRQDFGRDTVAGITVAVVALPLAMALAIASGAKPEQGLYTAIIGGLIVALLGGSRTAVSGPTGAFVVVVLAVIEKHGYDGLLLATMMAGVILIVAGLLRIGAWVKYVPHPVVMGFTAGIALIIFSTQIKDLLGLVPAEKARDVAGMWQGYFSAWQSFDLSSAGVAAFALGMTILVRRFKPALPAFLIAVVAASLLVVGLDLPVETIGSRFGGVPTSLPSPIMPVITWGRMGELLPSALIIAFLAGIESLLCAVVADSMTGGRHRSKSELVAQGIANIVSPLFSGLPVTGAIARTATNIRAGGRTPVASIMHAVCLVAFMIVLAPLAAYVPLSCLAAVLVVVAWNMAEIKEVKHLLKGPMGDRLVLVVTFFLTALVDLVVAIEVGIVMAAILFMLRMAQAVEIQGLPSMFEGDQPDHEASADFRSRVGAKPDNVEVLEIRGPFFFAAAAQIKSVLDLIAKPSRIFVLSLQNVPFVDATGINVLEGFAKDLTKKNGQLVLTDLSHPVRQNLNILHHLPNVRFAGSLEQVMDEFRNN